MRCSIEQCTFGYIRTIHLFQAHGLCTELQPIGIQRLSITMFVLNRVWDPESRMLLEDCPLLRFMEFDHIANT